MPRSTPPVLVALAALLLAAGTARAQGRVPFVFDVAPTQGNSFERDIRADVTTPGGSKLELLAFYTGGRSYSVRAAARERGVYRLDQVWELADGRRVPLQVTAARRADTVRAAATLPFVRVDPVHARHFVTERGAVWVPLGTNLGWAGLRDDPVAFYRREFADLGPLGVNWVRIWMAHWGRLNLDWFPDRTGPSPRPGTLDSLVARRIDAIVDAAGERGIYVQLVLQHHGQYSSQVNPNWAQNPWSTANGGFLARPADFFTSPEARRFTRLKFRYIVARWGYSPAILAWELFNEVQWVDALRLERNESAVAAWHAEMADYIRAIDPYHHPVTTSYDDLASPIFARMDFLQPHLYAGSGIAPLRQFYTTPPADRRPLFYGETGDDNFSLPPAVRRSGVALIHPLWAGLMGEAAYPAQMWYWDRLPDPKRHAEFAQFTAFVRAARLGRHLGLVPFAPAVESAAHIPLLVTRSRNQAAGPYPEIVVPADGSEPVAFAQVPQFLAPAGAWPAAAGQPAFPPRVAFRVHYPAPAGGRVHFDNVDRRGASARVTVDGAQVATGSWAASPDTVPRPADLPFSVAAGTHVVAVENSGRGRLEIGSIDLGLPVPPLAAIGKRASDFVMLWVWHREGFLTGAAPARATVLVPELPAGRWKVTWWGPTAADAMPRAATITHRGGTYRLDTPPIGRFAGVMLEAE